MSKNLRKHPREEIHIEVELDFLEDDTRKVMTQDVSHGGLFIGLCNSEHYTMGEMVTINFKHPLENFEQTRKDAIIVRRTDAGIAVAFIEMGDF